MKTRSLCFLLIQLSDVTVGWLLKSHPEGGLLRLSCAPQSNRGSPAGLYLFHRNVQSQTTLLSITQQGEVSLDPKVKARLVLQGGIDSPQINVSISDLRARDAGLYMWELSYEEDNSSSESVDTVVLLVEGTDQSCQSSKLMLLTVVAAAAFLLLSQAWVAVIRCMWPHQKASHSNVYEEMSGKHRPSETPQNNLEEEAHFPLYANTSVRPPQDNYYACPRQLTLKV